jgi:hypothetical protein
MDKYFPFYKMDVNGFIMHVNDATARYSEKHGIKSKNQIYNIDYVTLDSLKEAFTEYASWNDFK